MGLGPLGRTALVLRIKKQLIRFASSLYHLGIHHHDHGGWERPGFGTGCDIPHPRRVARVTINSCRVLDTAPAQSSSSGRPAVYTT